jgi:hypothetical protein
MFHRNVGGADRAVRVALGLFLLSAWGFLPGVRFGRGLPLLIGGLLLLGTGVAGFCPPYLLLGLSTVADREKTPGPLRPGRPLRKALRILGFSAAGLVGLAILGGALFGLEVASRKPLVTTPSTTHPALSRQACIDCHAPIAEEWRQSFHHKSLTGPAWKDVREMGYVKLFDRVRKACVNCHAPANVLDLAVQAPSGPSGPLGVECTPNVFREPAGTIPLARSDEAELGVDCVSCHVSTRGVEGSGQHPTPAHGTVADARFQSPSVTSTTLCRTCHSAAVEAWRSTSLAAAGVTCLDCHMPEIKSASVAGGPERIRRSHRFHADKDQAMLEKAVNASLTISLDRQVRFRITNDRVGHYFPSGGNWVSVKITVSDESGKQLKEQVEFFGRKEDPFFDFWPFNSDERIEFGGHREVLLRLPEGHGVLEATVRYHDWGKIRPTIWAKKEKF